MKHMRSLTQKVQKGENGFTLIELLIVIAILGVIAAVVILNVGGFLGQGTEEAAKTQLNTLQTAVMAAMSDGGCGQLTADQVIGENATSQTDPSSITICGDNTLSHYIIGDILGNWTIAKNGTITAGSFSSGGKICTWDGHSWTCSST